MKLLAFVPIKLTLILMAGILLGHIFPFDSKIALGLTLLFFISLGILYRYETNTKSVWFGVFAGLTTMSLGIFIILKAQPQQDKYHYSDLDLNQQPIWHLKIREVLKPTAFSERYIAEIKSVDSSLTTGKLIVSKSLNDSLTSLSIDDEIYTIEALTDIKPL